MAGSSPLDSQTMICARAKTPFHVPVPSFSSTPVQGDDLLADELNNRPGAPVDICCLDASLYTPLEIELTPNRISRTELPFLGREMCPF